MSLNTRGLDLWLSELDPTLDELVEEIAGDVERRAVDAVPVDTGALRTSIQIEGATGSMQRQVKAGQGLDYAEDVEFGTDKAAAQPFMTPAAEGVDMEAEGRKVFGQLESRSRI